MLRIGTVEERTRRRDFDEGNFRGHTEYLIETEAGPRPAPQAFLVHQDPDWVLPPHYHLEDQFQVVVRGGGMLGRHAMGPITVHYASRETAYGPLTAGSDGLDYFTLRVVTDPGAWYMPESRASMHRGLDKHQHTVGPIAVSQDEALAARREAGIDTLIEPDDSGLGAWMLRLPPASSLRAPIGGNGGGRFHIVAAGELRAGERRVPRLGCIYASADEGPLELVAGGSGVEVLVLQYPAAALQPTPALPLMQAPG